MNPNAENPNADDQPLRPISAAPQIDWPPPPGRQADIDDANAAIKKSPDFIVDSGTRASDLTPEQVEAIINLKPKSNFEDSPT